MPECLGVPGTMILELPLLDFAAVAASATCLAVLQDEN
jgi:hypothetical protein